MPLVEGGPPEWIWERREDILKPDVVPTTSPEGHTVYELRVDCGMEIVRLQFLTREEIAELASRIAELIS
jgi:hypothetical protein